MYWRNSALILVAVLGAFVVDEGQAAVEATAAVVGDAGEVGRSFG